MADLMNANRSTSPLADGNSSISISETDVSCRVPLFVLFVSAAIWLFLASVFGLMASVKFHDPNFLSNTAFLTYGRVHPVATNALLYGFGIQAGLGVALWILARLGNTRVAQPLVIAIGGSLWNLGVLVGIFEIFLGNSTGFEALEMPGYAAVFLFLGYLLIGICAATTLHSRRERRLESPQWFFLAALFWFAWIYSTAMLLLGGTPVRGITQAIVAWWFSANLQNVWLVFVGLAASFYFIPLLMNRKLHSQYLALLTFWTLILFASWSGIPNSAPVPAWIPAVSTVATVLTIITVLAVIVNVYKTVGYGCSQTSNPPSGKFFAFGIAAFVVAWLMNIAAAIPDINSVLHFTWFTTAQWHLNVYGFFSLTMLGAIYYIVPLVTGMEWPFVKWVRAHYWLAAIGTIVLVLPMAIGGVIQGTKLSNPQVSFIETAKGMLPFLKASSVGELFILLGHLLLLINIIALSVRYHKKHFVPVYEAATAELKPSEAKS
ncbi:MAG TPA: cbb3-type cytochrome c oxidase subunit I [Verrucomicrobiae bacterium]|nr:cbb3-type cytochrome c oxidase subunit I [Verrucomicrobiae bacterium]